MMSFTGLTPAAGSAVRWKRRQFSSSIGTTAMNETLAVAGRDHRVEREEEVRDAPVVVSSSAGR